MKYIVVTKNSRKSIVCTTLTQDENFFIFKKGKEIHMIAKEGVLSIFTDGYDAQDITTTTIKKREETIKEHNTRVLQLYRGNK